LGKEGWLFWASENDGDSISYFRGRKELSAADLSGLRDVLQSRSDRMRKRGARYILLLAPNKHTIYPEYMPDTISPSAGQSHFDRFVSYFRENSTVAVVDPRTRLFEAKRRRLTYHRTDTHWNAYGAYAAYRELIDVVRKTHPAVAPLKLSFDDFRQESGVWSFVIPSMRIGSTDDTPLEAPPSGDLAGMLALQAILSDASVTPKEVKGRCARLTTTLRRPNSWEAVKSGPHPTLGHHGILTTVCKGKPLNILIVHDSFGPLLIPYLAETFGRATYVWGGKGEIESFFDAGDYDLVIRVHIERRLLPGYF
jgi:hypothetical protein